MLKRGISQRFQFIQRARYHYDKDVYGYRTPRPLNVPNYSAQELANRNSHANVLRMVHAFREHGHKMADLDPLGLTPKNSEELLDPAHYGLNADQSSEKIPLQGLMHVGKADNPTIPKKQASIQTIIDHLKNTYSGRIGFEFEHVATGAERQWLADHIESYERKELSAAERTRTLELLSQSETFDHFMAKKFPQVKRYGLEGAESMMVALDNLFSLSANAGIDDIILCMPHRGRLNLLTGILKLPGRALFHKLKGNPEYPPEVHGIGDVISHLAVSTDVECGQAKTHVSLLHNPSHLEAVNPVAMGKARARQMYLYDQGAHPAECYLGDKVLCVQMHGDAAFTGQGVVTETLGLSNLPHFTSGGSIHLIVNNQIGYTTPAQNARSTIYTSDVGKMICAPVIHVNGDYPEDVLHAMTIAFEYRNKFRKDVIIDLIAYRRWGHNELDEPAFTQPVMYQNIRSHKSVARLYEDFLKDQKLVSSEEAELMRKGYFEKLEKELEESYKYAPKLDSLQGKWAKMIYSKTAKSTHPTGVEIEMLKEVGAKSVEFPSGFEVHPRLQKYHIEHRVKRVQEGTKLDWATAEALAFGSLLKEGYNVRISGQDVGRGTFSQRHVMLVDQKSERTIIPLNRMNNQTPAKQGKLEIANSSLSEFAVLGFEMGVSWETPNRLCIWEAQFGDFFNGAQIIIDTYLSSGEAKWFRQSGLVMLLPHGYDGAGPEHSSCRMERFLQLCDQSFDVDPSKETENVNMQVVFPTTPAQYFHVLRRQLCRPFRKPLIIVGPKVILRHPLATSNLADMQTGTHFKPVIDDVLEAPRRVLLLTGKLYYELLAERQKRKLEDKVALVRIEELCPFPASDIKGLIEKYEQSGEVFWIQEEPQNQGAWTYMEPRLRQILGSKKLSYIGRKACPAPAVGVGSFHKAELAQLMNDAFKGL